MKLSGLVVAGVFMISASAVSAQGITDAQIASIVVTANQVDVDAGKLAAAKGTNPEIKKFGQQMVTDHMGVNKSATELVTKLKVTPQDNPTSQAQNAGDSVVWVNKDLFPHTATSDENFDSQSIDAGKSWEFKPSAKGEFAYVCAFHPTMKATLRVN